MIHRVSRFIEYSLVAYDRDVKLDNAAQAVACREAAIRDLSSQSKKAGALLAHKLVMRFPSAAHCIQSRQLAKRGQQRISCGYEAVVFRDGNNALKVFDHTAKLEETERIAFIAAYLASAEALTRHLGSTVLPSELDIQQHPLTDERVVIASQPFVRFTPEDSVFPAVAAPVDRERLAAIEQRYAGAVQRLGHFGSDCLAAYEESLLLADLHGPDNLVIGRIGCQAADLYLIDPRPVQGFRPPDRLTNIILNQIEGLLSYHSAAVLSNQG